jgi:integration host factor subunit beta
MSEATITRELIERLAKESGITKKLAAEILHVIPGIIEEGLSRDGDARVKGLGTFRMKWTQPRVGRNPKTGERVEIQAHNRMVFLPEQSFKDFINRDYRLLGYKVIPGVADMPSEEIVIPVPVILPEPEQEPEPQAGIFTEPVPQVEAETEIPEEYEPEAPAVRRRIHWIIPTAISVIIILSLVFYFRNFYPVVSRQDSVVSHQSLVVSQDSVVSHQPLVVSQDSVSGQQSAVSGDQLEDSISVKPVPALPEAKTGTTLIGQDIRSPGDTTQNSIRQPADKIQNSGISTSLPSALKSKHITLTEGKHLFQLAREIYGNPYLWVLIYKANQELIKDPDQVIIGKNVQIPSLEGSPGKLSRSDSVEVYEGYRLVYEYYKEKGDSRAAGFHRAMEKYQPK